MTATTRVVRLLPALVLAACASTGGHGGPLVSDRPDFTESPDVVPTVQVEAGVTATSVAGGDRSVAIGELLVRVPVGSALEARFGIGSLVTSAAAGVHATGYEDPELQVKVALGSRDEQSSRAMPSLALIVGSTLPLGSRGMSARVALPGAKLAAGWDLGERVDLTSNVGWTWAGERDRRFGQGSGSLSLGVAPTDRLGSFLEYYEFLPGDAGSAAAHYGDAGLTYLVHPDLQVDVRAGVRLGGPRERFFGVGVARRW